MAKLNDSDIRTNTISLTWVISINTLSSGNK